MLRMRKDFELTCADGVKLFARVWEAEQPRAVLCLTHGLGEQGERYVPFAEVMNANGITVSYSLKPHKVFLFNKETEERIRFEVK